MFGCGVPEKLSGGVQAHQRLGLRTIKCRIQKANRQTLRMHMM